MQPKILVIGSRDHDRANCVDWLQPFPNIEEYDSIIINMQSLTQNVYDKIQMKIRGMKESVRTIIETHREIFCIMNKLIHPSPAPRPFGAPVYKAKRTIAVGYVSPTNYDWLPVRIKVDNRKRGTSTILYDHKFDRYFDFVDRWSFEINTSLGTTRQDKFAFMFYGIVPIATNKSKKTIAGNLKRETFGKIQEKGAVHLLPPPTKCDTHQAIEIILDLICGEEGKVIPVWRKDIDAPRVKELEQEIENKIKSIKGIQQEISQLRGQVQEWDSYRDLLTATGYDLEKIVQKTLLDIGIKTKKTEKGFPADLISNEVAVEITGIKGCVGASSEKVNQTGRFKESYHKGEKIILIANTHMDLSPKDRKGKMDFSPEVKKYFESLSVCCLTTKTLFQLWKDVVTGKRGSKDVRRKILTKNGELTPSEFE